MGDGNPFDQGSGCTWNQMPVSCGCVAQLLGPSVIAPAEQTIAVRYQGKLVLAHWQAYADRYQGFVPVNARNVGEGHIGSIGPPKLLRGRNSSGDIDLGHLNGVSGDDPEEVLARRTAFPAFASSVVRAGFSPRGGVPPQDPLPCNDWAQQLRDMTQVAKGIRGRIDLNETRNDNITYIAGVTTSQGKLVAQFSSFFDPMPEHSGGTDVKTLVNQRWYHLTIGYGHT